MYLSSWNQGEETMPSFSLVKILRRKWHVNHSTPCCNFEIFLEETNVVGGVFYIWLRKMLLKSLV